ncbi:MAG: hypothetical protein PHC51_07755 [bacterium]|nr:hypothetical protein [bacterium]
MSSFVEPHELLWSEVAAIANAEGLHLYDLERGGGGLRVFVQADKLAVETDDSAEGQAGVTSGDCSRLCRRLMFFFSVEGGRLGVGSEPSIEVSSPGINRRLRLPWHFRSALGQEVKITGIAELVAAPADAGGVQTISGRLHEIKGDEGAEHFDSVVLVTDKDKVVVFPFDSIQKARVEFTF